MRLDHAADRPAGSAELDLQRAGAQRVFVGLADVAEVAVHGGQVGGQHRQLGEVAQLARAFDGAPQRLGGAAQAARRVQHVGEVGPVVVALLQRAVGLDLRLEWRQHGLGFSGTALLRQADGEQARRLEAQPRLVQPPGQQQRLARAGHTGHVIGRHQRDVGARGQRRHALRVGPRHRQHALAHRLRLLDAAHQDQALDARAAGIEGGIGVAGAVEAGDRRLALLRFLGAPRPPPRDLRRAQVELRGAPPPPGAGVVLRDARRRRRLRLQVLGDAAVEQLADRRRDGAQCDVAHQVVREPVAGQHVRPFQLGPGVDEIERMRLQHVRRQRGAEIHARQCRHAGEPQRRRAQLRQPALDQGAHGRRGRHSRALAIGLRQVGAERFQDEVRIAAGVAGEGSGQDRCVDPVERQRIEQPPHVGFGERWQGDFDQRDTALGALPGSQRRRHLGTAHRERAAKR